MWADVCAGVSVCARVGKCSSALVAVLTCSSMSRVLCVCMSLSPVVVPWMKVPRTCHGGGLMAAVVAVAGGVQTEFRR